MIYRQTWKKKITRRPVMPVLGAHSSARLHYPKTNDCTWVATQMLGFRSARATQEVDSMPRLRAGLNPADGKRIAAGGTGQSARRIRD